MGDCIHGPCEDRQLGTCKLELLALAGMSFYCDAGNSSKVRQGGVLCAVTSPKDAKRSRGVLRYIAPVQRVPDAAVTLVTNQGHA